MSRRARLQIFLVCWLLPGWVQGQYHDHLLPEDSVHSLGWNLEYETNVAKVLAKGLPDWRVKMTSRRPIYRSGEVPGEYAVGLQREDGLCRAVLSRATLDLWRYELAVRDPDARSGGILDGHPKDPLDVPVEVTKRALSAALCERIEAAWAHVLSGTRYPPLDAHEIMLDAVSYHFSAWKLNVGILSGTTLSPQPDSIPGRLVEVAKRLEGAVRDGEGASLATLEEALSALETALAAAEAAPEGAVE